MIDLNGVAKRYEIGTITVTALEHLDLHIGEGEFIVVLGPSGSGKTTMLNMIGALDTPTEGRITVDGQQVTGASTGQLFAYRRSKVSFIFQSFNLFPGLTARENVQFGIDAANRSDGGRSAIDVLTDVGLGRAGQPISHTNSRAASSSVSPSPAPSPPETPFSLPMSPQGSLISQQAPKSLNCSSSKRSRARQSSSSPTTGKSPAWLTVLLN